MVQGLGSPSSITMQLQFCYTKLNPTSRIDVMSLRISRCMSNTYFFNRRCCCTETPQMTGWKFDIFTCTIMEISKIVDLCSNAHIHNKPMLYETYASIAGALSVWCAKWIAKSAWQSFLQNNFADFLDEVRVKKSRFWTAVGCVSLPIQQLLLLWAYFTMN